MAAENENGGPPPGTVCEGQFDPGHGHFFVKKTFHKPTYCHHCTDMLWGLIGQGYICEVCNFVVHDRCLKTVVSPCTSIATNLIKVTALSNLGMWVLLGPRVCLQ
ncbi:diacylglycerol kinase theta-like isoform X2 [Lingula anatina]|uniref:Diacylglycerol kinase theta-like isoform X1 n=1 Tax=Lingula anatina TaxID=7574 RepID=A0A2R2MTM4_LINAN|nr:diacylglycerol kinase theta-like isoform X1 [Lingula anatina]XP_023933372.1 diacylglycerol kinase theta-like isoform X2 [Lingula anatina]|eukprot:XP_023933371.1 diacylglycerol kinase theta-like isoform X1 [Lingula anatina]